MTFQWKKWMDQWIKETTPSKTWGKTRRDGWEEAITHMPHATNHSESLCESLFFIQPNFTAAFSCSSLHTDWHEQNCPSVLQMVQLLLYSCHTDFVLTLAAWNTGSSESLLEHLALAWSEKQGFFTYFWCNILETHALNSGNFCCFIFLDKGSSKKKCLYVLQCLLEHSGKRVLCVLLVGINIVMNHW